MPSRLNAPQVRRRASYQRFKELYEYITEGHQPEEILYRVHRLMDAYRGFHSKTESERALESIRQAIADVPVGGTSSRDLYHAAGSAIAMFDNWGDCSDWPEAQQAWKESVDVLRAAIVKGSGADFSP